MGKKKSDQEVLKVRYKFYLNGEDPKVLIAPASKISKNGVEGFSGKRKLKIAVLLRVARDSYVLISEDSQKCELPNGYCYNGEDLETAALRILNDQIEMWNKTNNMKMVFVRTNEETKVSNSMIFIPIEFERLPILCEFKNDGRDKISKVYLVDEKDDDDLLIILRCNADVYGAAQSVSTNILIEDGLIETLEKINNRDKLVGFIYYCKNSLNW